MTVLLQAPEKFTVPTHRGRIWGFPATLMNHPG